MDLTILIVKSIMFHVKGAYMKIAIKSSGENLDNEIDLRFGRAKGFIIYETNDDSFEFIDNVHNLEAAQGAGIQAAQNVVNKNVEAVITGHCGPKPSRFYQLQR